MTTRTRQVDVAIVGAGTAGMSARQQVARAGKSYVLIEKGELGTTCALLETEEIRAHLQNTYGLDR